MAYFSLWDPKDVAIARLRREATDSIDELNDSNDLLARKLKNVTTEAHELNDALKESRRIANGNYEVLQTLLDERYELTNPDNVNSFVKYKSAMIFHLASKIINDTRGNRWDIPWSLQHARIFNTFMLCCIKNVLELSEGKEILSRWMVRIKKHLDSGKIDKETAFALYLRMSEHAAYQNDEELKSGLYRKCIADARALFSKLRFQDEDPIPDFDSLWDAGYRECDIIKSEDIAIDLDGIDATSIEHNRKSFNQFSKWWLVPSSAINKQGGWKPVFSIVSALPESIERQMLKNN